MSTLKFDDESARRLEMFYSYQDMRGQRDEAMRRLAPTAGEAVIDIGCGPGFLIETIADAVSSSGRAVGIDISDELLDMARRRNRRPWLDYRTGDAMALKEADATFDVAVSMQVLEYLPDADAGIREINRILRSGGRALVVATDWDGVVWHSEHPQRMREIMKAWERHCTDPHLPRTLLPRFREAGFDVISVEGFSIVNTAIERSYSQGLLKLAADFVVGKGLAKRSDVEAWVAEQYALDQQGRYFFGSMRYFVLLRKPG